MPDITNKQVQINTEAPALSPMEIEKQVTFPIETALAGMPGLESTRSISRNGFSQVTAVFRDNVDIYFARQQVNERLTEARESLPPGAEPTHGAHLDGAGRGVHVDGRIRPATDGHDRPMGHQGGSRDGTYLTPEGQRLTNGLERAAYLRTVQDWIIRPQLKNVAGVAGVDAIGGYVKQYHVQPDPMQLVAYGLTFQEIIEALERNNVSTGAGYIEHKGEAYIVRADGRIANEAQIASIVVGTRQGTPIYIRDVATVGIGRELRTGGASENGAEVVVGTALMLLGENSRTVAAAVDDEDAGDQQEPAAACPRQDRAEPLQAGQCDHQDGREEPGRRRPPGDRRVVPPAGQPAGGADHGPGHSALYAPDRHWHGASRGQRQPHEPGRR